MNILVVHTARIGDLVSGMGVVNFLRDKFGRVQILPNPRYRGIIKGEPGIIAVSPDEARLQRYDFLIDLSSSRQSAGYVRSIPAKKKICLYSSAAKLICALPFYHVCLKREDTHIVRAYSPVLRYFCWPGNPTPALTDNGNANARRMLKELRDGKKLAGIHFDAATERRFLPEDLVAKVIESFRERGIRVALIRTRNEIARRLETRSGGYARWRRYTLAELKTVIAGLDLFIGADSGPLHIAAALGIPSVGIYGPNIPAVSGPLAPCVRFVEIPLDCRPCNQNHPCPHDVRCLQEITSARVMAEADLALSMDVRNDISFATQK